MIVMFLSSFFSVCDNNYISKRDSIRFNSPAHPACCRLVCWWRYHLASWQLTLHSTETRRWHPRIHIQTTVLHPNTSSFARYFHDRKHTNYPACVVRRSPMKWSGVCSFDIRLVGFSQQLAYWVHTVVVERRVRWWLCLLWWLTDDSFIRWFDSIPLLSLLFRCGCGELP